MARLEEFTTVRLQQRSENVHQFGSDEKMFVIYVGDRTVIFPKVRWLCGYVRCHLRVESKVFKENLNKSDCSREIKICLWKN